MAAAKEKKTTAKKTTKAPKAAKSAASAGAAGTTESTGPKTIKFQDYTISKKRSGRYEVCGTNGKNINGMDKAKILVDAKLIKTGLGKAPPPPAATEAPAGEEAPQS